MGKTILVALRVALVTLGLTGLVYPLAGTALSQLLFPREANGSLIVERGRAIGSALVGQRFTSAAYFHGRPSAAGEEGYDATASGGSNLSTTSRKLRDRGEAERVRLIAENPGAQGEPPGDLLAASASGLDPHVSPEAARWQIPRVARARGVAPERLRALVEAHAEDRTLGFLGEPRVNVLLLDLALDRLLGPPPGSALH